MPRIIIEHSSNVIERATPELFLELHQFLIGTGQFNLHDIKSRAVVHDNYLVADGAPNRAFITCQVKILSGRETKFKKEISEGILEVLRRHFAASLRELSCDLTVYVSEIEKETYSKVIRS